MDALRRPLSPAAAHWLAVLAGAFVVVATTAGRRTFDGPCVIGDAIGSGWCAPFEDSGGWWLMVAVPALLTTAVTLRWRRPLATFAVVLLIGAIELAYLLLLRAHGGSEMLIIK
ncbi:hypothetical protein [Patulibacter defluvii]|uniref:hypothetical protein n=1 Tax=Patulibacter defluvii TaxID=3095358 RepID=UPI002A74BFF4|nr:hypothetical protein [Patulibacter sp. DM4]